MINLNAKKYETIDGLRTISCIGIVLMHILDNGKYILPKTPTLIISCLTNFVFLFMTISAFCMCCGYFDKFKSNKISVVEFYSKRVNKLLPFFLFLIIIDIIVEHSIPSIIEGFADSTLLFGLLQKNITVIGVGWFLGLIFIFYLIFPYFVYLFSNKKRAWFTTIVSILMTLSCIYYFHVDRVNMFYSFIYFCIGGLIFLYKDSISKFFQKSRIIGILFIVTSIIVYFVQPMKNEYTILLKTILASTSLLCYAISYNSIVLKNKITRFIGNISFEIYLCHMVVFRVLERLKLINMIDNSWFSYILTFLLVMFGSVIISTVFKKLYSIIMNKLYSRKGALLCQKKN